MQIKIDSIQKLQQLPEGERINSFEITFNFYKNTIDRKIKEAFGLVFPADMHFQQWIINALEYDFDSEKIINSIQPLVAIYLEKKASKIVPVAVMHPEIEKIYQKEPSIQKELEMILVQLDAQVNNGLEIFKPINTIETIEDQIVDMVFIKEGNVWEFLTFNHVEEMDQDNDHLYTQNRKIETYKILMDNQMNKLMSYLLTNSVESNSKQILARCLTNGANLEMKELLEAQD